MNTLYLGDCLNVLRDNVPDESVDLVYIDPPFNSKRDYNIFFDDKEIQTQRIAFEDTWTLKNIQDSLAELHTLTTDNAYYLLLTYQKVAPHAFPYLTMMALRILELHRVLKPTGSFYLHCDPTMSAYLRTVCDLIFEAKNFRNEIVWKRASAHNDPSKYGNIHDVILFYSKSDKYNWNPVYTEYTEAYLDAEWRKLPSGRLYKCENMLDPRNTMKEYEFEGTTARWRTNLDGMLELWNAKQTEVPNSHGRIKLGKDGKPIKRCRIIFLDEMPGTPLQSWWDDIISLRGGAKERLGYPTQKPKALLERIIQASSNEGDIVLDGFCGCGTTIDAAEELHRNWIGVDISPIAISLIKRRLKDTYKEGLSKFEVRGTPADEQSAIELWKQNANAFQDWWLTEFEVFSTTFGTKGADKGVDGLAQYLIDPKKQDIIKAAFQVKGGEHVESKDIDALLGAMDKHKCEIGVFLTIATPTKPMLDTVAGSGFVEIPGYKIPKLQILTLKDYFKNKLPKLPQVNITFKAAQLKGKRKQNQMNLGV